MARESVIDDRGALIQFCDLKTEDDLQQARSAVKLHCQDLGFSKVNQTKIVTAASELGRNTIEHGKGGHLTIKKLSVGTNTGIRLVFTDDGPGIENMDLALTDGYTSKKGLGLGLTGSQRLMDEFDIDSRIGVGTIVVVTKWI
ncbi:MAG TPA: anti-sigma regulatory factor [Drouetiella sp.]